MDGIILGTILSLAGAVAGMIVLYWVIRAAVRHALADARRDGAGSPPAQTPVTSSRRPWFDQG